MKRLAYISLAFFATAALFSCTEKSTYEPGPQPEGAQYYFSADQATAVNITPTTQSVSVDVFRVETGSASTATVSVVDESGLISSASSVTANFAAGSNKATLTFPITPADWEFAKGYPVTFTIFDESTPYGKSEVTVTYKYPTPLTLLGNAVVTETYLTGGQFKAAVYRSDIDPNEYHIEKFMGSKAKTLIIHVTKPGDEFGGKTFTKADLVYYDDTDSGLTYASVGGSSDDPIYVCHPAGFKSTGDSEEKWIYNRVALYQENGIPAIVEIAPFYYMFGLGGWNKTTAPTITIVFPGYEPKDYAVEATYAGLFTERDGTVYGEATVTLGADLEGGVAVIVPGADEDAIAAGIEKLVSDEAVAFDGSTVRVPLPKDVQTGFYTIVVGGVAEDVVQAVDAVPFYYQGGPLDWDWLLGDWGAYDYNLSERVVEGDPYGMTIAKVDDTHIKIGNLWGTEAELDAVVDFDAMTITIPGNQFAYHDSGVDGDCNFVAVDPENEFDTFEDLTTPVIVKMTPGGLVIDNYDFLITSGKYKGYTYDGGIRTTMFKPLP